MFVDRYNIIVQSSYTLPVKGFCKMGLRLNTIYERINDTSKLQSSGMAVGKIISVDPVKRFCEVQTIYGDPGFNDRHLAQVQWLSTDANPEGDESTCIPRRGSMGIVFFVSGVPYIWGYMKATDPTKGAVTGKEPSNLNEGDKVISTVGGNRVVVKANGSIEIFSKENLKQIFFPKTGLLSSITRNWMHKSDGGTITWMNINDANQTLWSQEARADMARTSVVLEQKGAVSATVVKRVAIGPMVPGDTDIALPVFEQTVDRLGTVVGMVGTVGTGSTYELSALGGLKWANNIAQVIVSETGDIEASNKIAKITATSTGDLEVSNKAGKATISSTGAIEVSNKVAKFTAADTGDLEISNKVGKATISASGAVEVSNKIGKITVTDSGEIEIANKVGKLKIDPSGKIGLGGPAAELLDLFNQELDVYINAPSVCMTPVGPSGPLLPPIIVQLKLIQGFLKSIKGSV